MEAYNVDSIKTDTFTASRVTRNTYKPTGEIPKQFKSCLRHR